ncbi:NFACT family protein [Cyanobium sp. Morenito 9A2]|uniref:Rqc2 family fibronectin-binding protein n=1 Tax=Cyanobium sp. Morenito 9A2 TaxID=2823718 RepID=UPI0020CF3004|nr:NFACT RNA binding domain-containing protein [Cyanobium sp. Morenito 9A2]MCP9848300.1 NFACT family protein [Cyanobium sp. Morenito 9A2]
MTAPEPTTGAATDAQPRPLPLQALDVTSLKAVLAELRPALLPCRFEKAQQSASHTLQLGLRGLDHRLWLEISWQAEAPRLLAIAPPPRSGAGSTLAQQMQHGLAALALVELEQRGWERVLELRFARRPGDPIVRTLMVELMGRHSNLFLLDEQRRVVTLARQVKEQHSRLRPIGTGDAYVPPPSLQGRSPSLDESFAVWKSRLTLVPVSLRQALQEAYQGISPALALQLAGDQPAYAKLLLDQPVRGLADQQWQQLWCRWRRWLEVVASGAFQFAPGGSCAYRCWSEAGAQTNASKAQASEQPLNRALAGYYAQELGRRLLSQRLGGLRQRASQAIERERRLLQQQEQLLAKVEDSDGLQERAHSLLSGLAPNREQIDEAQRLYRQARKLRRSAAAINPRIAHHRQRLERLEASLTFMEQADDLAQLETLEIELQELHAESRPSKRPLGPGGPSAGVTPQPLELRTGAGLRVQVGRNHRQNEWISLRQARRGDLWFHAQECPGSHVVLKSSESPAQDEDLRLAADLAAHFSRARGNGRVAVVMVPTEQLQRIPGAGAGTVRHKGGEQLWACPGRAAAWLNRPAAESAEPLPSLGSAQRP